MPWHIVILCRPHGAFCLESYSDVLVQTLVPTLTVMLFVFRARRKVLKKRTGG
jgi:hypothetical protein